MTAFAASSTIVLHDFNSETSNDIKIAVPLYPPCGPPNVILIFNFSRSIFFQMDLLVCYGNDGFCYGNDDFF